MPALSPALNNRLHDTLARCHQFDSDEALRGVFVDERIHLWRNEMPGAKSPSERIAAVIDALHGRANAQGQNALVLFLQVLADQYAPGDALNQELDALTRALADACLPGVTLDQEREMPAGASRPDAAPPRVDRKAIGIAALVVILLSIAALSLGYPGLFRGPAFTPTPASTLTPTPPSCPGKGTTDEEIVLDLIEQERLAVLTQDIDLITSIFAPKVVIQDIRNELVWTSAVTHYTEMFHNQIHCRIDRTDYAFKPESDGIKVTCLSSGTWGVQGQGHDCPNPFENDLNTWGFRKDEVGCWRIVEFTYNSPQE